MSDKNDLLRRQDCIETIEEITSSMSVCVNTDECHGMKRMQRQAVLEIANMPAAQPEPHEGYWIGGDGSYICSECNSSPMDFIDTIGASFDAYVEIPMNYCPNCGAKMNNK